jgi:hypothetical protein
MPEAVIGQGVRRSVRRRKKNLRRNFFTLLSLATHAADGKSSASITDVAPIGDL